MSGPTNPLVSKAELAGTLRQLRTAAGRTLDDAAEVLEVSAATISRIETGSRIPRARDVRELCRYYGVDDPDRVEELAALVADARATAWWEEYDVINDDYAAFIGYEEAAGRIEQFENTTIPALLQTRAYAHHYFADVVWLYLKGTPSKKQNDERIKVRELRWAHLVARAPEIEYSVILDEAALHRVVGGADVMREQVARLVEVAQEPWLSLYILPLDKGVVAGPAGPFTALTLPQEQVTDVLYFDTLRGQEFLRRAGQLELHKRVLSHVRSAALDPSDSVQFLRAMMRRN
ncbi:helix-turn-helix domain-containing protein [Kineosporia babensis]|uniref:Helix-turn-helix domain-containing protein n=1 Tax=Kineosporia babensis TaxID=499548 RepID=A0A9X1NIZ3_9ACTN|nr:helix-turn-helix transcriptional regulator [Kineosporia babensis]MCD5314955.1 helix-turn-helix domain-containing protein [Kineosporia babensis]